MRRAPVYALLALALAFVASCSDRNPAGPSDPTVDSQLNMHLSECWPDDVVGQIEALFPDTGVRVAALAMFDNILRDVERGALREAETKADAFARFVGNKENKLNDPCGDNLPTQDQAETVLIGNVYAIAGGGAPLVIPPEAYGDFGGIGLIDPVTGGVVTGGADDFPEAAVIADPGSFDGTGLVTIVLARLPDPDVEEPPASGPIPGYQAYPEGWNITSSRQLADGGTGAIVELCVLETVPADIDPRLVIGHDLGGGQAELLYPRLLTSEVICDEAGGYYPGEEPVAFGASPWLHLASRLIEPAKNLLSPKPLHAMYFAGRGLGGRTTSFSNFAPVDPWSLSVSPESATISIPDGDPTVQLTATLTVPAGDPLAPVDPVFTWTSLNESVAGVDANGLVAAESEGTAIIEVTYAGLAASSEITVEVTEVGQLVFASGRDGSPDIFLINTDGTGLLGPFGNAGAVNNGPSWSPGGFRIAFSSDQTEEFLIYTMNPDGTAMLGPFGVANASWPTWSPSGTQIAYSSGTNLRIMNADGTNDAPLATVTNAGPSDWSPDGTKIAVTAGIQGQREILVINADGTGVADTLTTGDDDKDPAWSPDGTKILFVREIPDVSEPDIYVMDADGSNLVNLTDNGGTDSQPGWSPDGTKIAFWSNRSGTSLIWVMGADGSNPTAVTQTGPDFDPEWRPDPPIIN